MRDIDELFFALEKSDFRRKFKLNAKDAEYLNSKGLETVLEHGCDFVRKRLAPAEPVNDGRQTPMRNHPVFTAQHATGTCCRKCLQKWHGIPAHRPLSEEQIECIVTVLGRWLKKFCN